MKLSQAKEYLPFVQAAAEGKTIQIKGKHGAYKDWTDLDNTFCNLFASTDEEVGYTYRIKPESRLRPWKPEEVPVGALLRRKFNPKREAVIVGVSVSGFAPHVKLCGNLDASVSEHLKDLFTYHGGHNGDMMEYSLDNGKTWLPCGVEESQS